MLVVNFILLLLVNEPTRHELNRDPDMLDTVATFFTEAAEFYDVEVRDVVYHAYRESRFDHTARGRFPNKDGKILREVGYPQAHGAALRLCKQAGHDPATREGGAYCTALLINEGREVCGNKRRGLNWVMSGKCRSTERTWEKAAQRLERAAALWEEAGIK